MLQIQAMQKLINISRKKILRDFIKLYSSKGRTLTITLCFVKIRNNEVLPFQNYFYNRQSFRRLQKFENFPTAKSGTQQ